MCATSPRLRRPLHSPSAEPSLRWRRPRFNLTSFPKDSNLCYRIIAAFLPTSEPGLAKQGLTPKQQAVYEFLVRYIGEHRQSPLIREIQLACQIFSYKSAVDRLNALEHKRVIRRIPNKHRGIQLRRRASDASVIAEPPSMMQDVG